MKQDEDNAKCRNEAVDDFAFTAGISIPLGDDNRNRGQIAALQAKSKQNQMRFINVYRHKPYY